MDSELGSRETSRDGSNPLEMPGQVRARYRWLRPPVFADQAKAHEAFLLHVILWSLTVMLLPFLLFTVLRVPVLAGRALAQTTAGVIINLGLMALLRKGAVRLASILQVASLFTFMTVIAATRSGIESPAYQLGYSLTLVVAGVLIGLRGAVLVTLAALACGLILQSRGSLDPAAVTQRTSIWISSCVLFPILAVLQYLASRTARDALERASVGEQKFRLLTEASFEGIIVHDEGMIVEANQRCAELFGFERVQELVGTDRAERLRVPDELSPSQHLPDGTGVEMVGVRRDGSTFPAEMQTRAIQYRGNERRVVAVRDITEHKRIVQERAHLERQLAQSQRLESIGRLAGGVAHDFNNLLTVIMGNISLLQSELRDSPLASDRLSEVMEASEGAARLTRQLLTVGRKEVTRPERLDPNRVVADTQRVILRLLGARVDLRASLGPEVGDVVIDASQLEQILVNLCINARDAMPDGGGLEIRTDLTQLTAGDARAFVGASPGEFVRIGVSDTGTGIPERLLAHVCEPFFTTKEPGRGTGLGLATVHGIVSQNGGFLRIFSEVGKGTRVDVCLPRAPVD
ncbi:MAG: ATP-binding protein [Polyangiaceae bacterium]